ncbi:sigma-70 family RNA polymerase sigma factor [Streptomyces hoynatensis]|uniref:Sigma-70 family RNA polymerase sigma factor n=1 Tax=Streptomyces hoynatensis TaxID=1141874 RepID=A0A3A9YT36_9ACTN|nr:sigma-70 family RNA polymerase sigma factor [Streptomyces hoynatensis]RKN39198.1 sigma-70 family RNA polymerase sigma factor [Streptomyces hoynatensis]
MDERELPAERFEEHRGHLRAVAYRMLGSLGEAEDAVQETWLRLARVDASGIVNLAAWLQTVLSRVCLDMLRARQARPEEPVGGTEDAEAAGRPGGAGGQGGPEEEVLLAESVGRALLVVLGTLSPAERIAFVLHDVFAVPFGDVAAVLDRTPVAAKKLASRARARVRGTPAVPAAELARQREVVEAFLAAARGGDLAGLLAVLAPDVVRRADPAALSPGAAPVVRGARAVAEESVALARTSRHAQTALVDGAVGIVVAPRGRLLFALTVAVEGERIAAFEVIARPERLRRLSFAVLGG